MWGFEKVVNGTDRGSYYHELFLRGRPDLAKIMFRTRAKGNMARQDGSQVVRDDPDFYSYPYCTDKEGREIIRKFSGEESENGKHTPVDEERESTPDPRYHWQPRTMAPDYNPISPLMSSSTTPPPYRDNRQPYHVTPPRRHNYSSFVDRYDFRPPNLDDRRYPPRYVRPFRPRMREIRSDTARERFLAMAKEFCPPAPARRKPLRSRIILSAGDYTWLPRYVGEDEANFEGRTFQCVDDSSLTALESILSLDEEDDEEEQEANVNRMSLPVGSSLVPVMHR